MINRKVLQTVRVFSRRLIGQGAEAIVLFGSRVRGDAYKESDVDVHVIGKGARYTLELYRGYLLSVSRATRKQHLKTFKDPGQVCGVVPAWRNAMIIYDPHGVAGALKQKAELWKWGSLGERADRWVAEELTGYAEEVHRLVGNLQLKRRSAASVVRSVLAIRMAPILAVRHRVFYDSENQLWDLVSARMGTEWSRVQSVGLGEDGESFEDTCKAALQLFMLTAREVRSLLNSRQLAVVFHACDIANHLLASRRSARSRKLTLLGNANGLF